MQFLALEFQSFVQYLKRRLETLPVLIWITITVFSAPVGCIGALLLIIHTSVVRWFVILYLLWVFLFDWDTCERGGWSDKRTRWMRNLALWRYCRDYFPMKLVKTAELDPSRNYLLCCFPHGFLSAGVGTMFCTEALGFKDLFPGLRPRLTTLSVNFKLPLFREYFYSVGMCSSSKSSITYLLTQPKSGTAVGLVIGGSAEATMFRPGTYTILLKKRKGFVKVALENGTPLVPVFCFGETDIYDQVQFSNGSFLKSLQDLLLKYTGYALILPMGRGFFQDSFGLIPRQKPMTIVVGSPLEVPKIAYPEPQQVEEYHRKFQEALENLFNTYKYKYLGDPANTQLHII